MTRPNSLEVWMGGVRVATITSKRRAEIRLKYSDEALDRWPLNTPLLSCSLPLTTRPLQAGTFFRGLLPEGDHLQSLAARAEVTTNDTYGLLARYGKDVAGAVVITEGDPALRPGSVVDYTPESLEEEVAALPDRPLGVYDDSELSLPGLQNKLLLMARPNGGWGRPVHGLASTHILKTEDRRYPGLAMYEESCLRLATLMGLTNVTAAVETIAGVPCLIVSRFDRTTSLNGTVIRVHQEDVCQALGRDPDAHQGRGKYESHGGPRWSEVAGLIDRYSVRRAQELEKLVRIVVFTIMIGNADAHGKNLALLHPEPENIYLAPLYDTVPTAMWPKLRTDAAMTVGGVQVLSDIGLDDVVREVGTWSSRVPTARDLSMTTAEEIAQLAEDAELPRDLKNFIVGRAARFVVR
jgi:serine/threonine-protein kinase HipA